jgi:hypothetical protein
MSSRAAVVVFSMVMFIAGPAFAEAPAALSADQIAFVWRLLERNARNSADAGFLLYVLHREPGDPLKQGWTKFAQGEQWLDWWLILRPKTRRPLTSDEYFLYIDDLDESEMRAVAERPKLLERIVRARLYLLALGPDGEVSNEPISIRHIKEAWLDWEESAYLENESGDRTDFSQGYYDSDTRRFSYWCRHVNSLRRCLWLFGRGDEVKNVTNFTWKREYLAFRKWIVENEPYFRFDSNDYRFVLDREAKGKRKPVPQESIRISPPTTPFPDWAGPLPTAYDYDLFRN